MKKMLLLFTALFFISCDFSQLFKKEITAIVCVDQVNVLPNEEIAFDLSVLPEKMTIPEWKIEYDNTSLEFTTVEIPGVTPKYERTVKALKTGKYPLKITETTSRLSKTVIVNCADMIDDFILPATKILALNTSFRIADYVTFIPAENIIYDFEYEFDSPLLTYNPQNGYFKTGNQTGEAEIMVKETKTALSKPIKIVISDQYLTFEPVTVEMLKETPLPDEIINHIVKNNLKIVYPENDGLIINTDKYTVLATAAKTWTVEFYLTIDGEDSLFGYSEITARPLENPVFDIEVPMITETPIPDEIKTYIISNNLELVYTENDGLFIDTVKYTILTTKAQTWIVDLYRTFDGQKYQAGRLQINSDPIETTPFEKIELDVGIKKAMPETLVQFIKDNQLEADYALNTGLSIELKDYSLTASDSGDWEVEFFKTVNGQKFIFGTVPVHCADWFSVDFYYGQRVFVSEQWKMTDTDTELLDQLKNMNNLDVNYSWSGQKGRAMRGDNNGIDERKKAADLLGFGAATAVFGSSATTDKCIAQNTWKRLVNNLTESFSFSKDNINYNYFSNGQNQNNLSYYEYTTTLYFDSAHKNNFIDLGECHGTEGGAGGSYHHVFYTYPKTKKSAYETLKSELDKHFSDCITKVKEDFLTGADKQQYDLESFYTTSTDGLFQIRKNQDGGNYSETIVSGTDQSEVMTIPTLKKTTGSYSKINFDAPTMTIRKSRATIKEPVFPIVRRITVNWTSEVLVYTGFIQDVTEDNHDISVVENPEEKNIVIAITEKNLSDENSILNGVIGYVTFEDQSKNSVTKRIEIRKINE
ncbi:MAG: hypothetical protein SOZ27_04230 [Spirochaetia bacterium]|nr:hypothetical protein [Spirochaetia bacterium]